MRDILVAGGGGPDPVDARHAAGHPAVLPARLRPGDPRGRPVGPPRQARHAHHGRHRDRAGLAARLRRLATLATLAAPTVSGLLVLFLMTGLGAVGFLDDFIKIYKQRSLGLRSGAKALGQLVVGAIFAVLVTAASPTPTA